MNMEHTYRTIFISDVHLVTKASRVNSFLDFFDNTQQIIDWIHEMERRDENNDSYRRLGAAG